MKELVKKGKVYVLNSCYKDNDNEILGTFDSMDALLVYFARTVAADHKDDDHGVSVDLVATLTASLIGKGSNDDGCVDGRTRYWYSEFDILGFPVILEKVEDE